MSPDAGFPVEVNLRLESAHEMALANVQRADRAALVSSIRLAHASRSAVTSQKKIFWLRKSADAFNQAYADNAACLLGCTHCCHIRLQVSEQEAKLIAKETGHHLAFRRGHVSLEPGYDNPCPFLLDSQCSIYPSRPLACRIHVNMDLDDFLCRLVPGTSIPVPYADKRFIIAEMLSQLPNSSTADIREWFAK